MTNKQSNIGMEKNNEHVMALQQAFTAHVKHNESKIKDMEKKMENKSMSINTINTNDNAVHTRLDHVEQMCRTMSALQNSNVTDIKSLQLAEFERFLKTGAIESKSMGTVDSDGGVLLNQPVSQEIWSQMQRFALIDGAKQIKAKGKTIHVIKDKANSDEYAQWSKDGYDPKADTLTPDLHAIEMKTNTCMASTGITRDLLDDDTEHTVHEWISNAITKSFAAKMSFAMLYGTAEKSMEGIFTYDANAAANGNKEIDKVDIVEDKEIDGLLAMISKLDVAYIDNAAWYMSKGFFAKLLNKLLANNSTQFTEMFKMRTENDTHSYTLLGKPLHIIPPMQDNRPVILADLKSGYYIVHNQNGTIKRTEAFELDEIRYGYRLRVGGQVIDPDAFIIGQAV